MPSNSPQQVAEQYFELWSQKEFQKSRQYLADDLDFKGPFDTFHRADDLIQALSRLMPIVKEIRKRRVFTNDSSVCIVYDMVSIQGFTSPIAEMFEVGPAGKITAIEVIFDARPFLPLFAGEK